jgi:hypothetical protein
MTMLRNYRDSGDSTPPEAPAKPEATPSQDPLRELQRRYAKTLAACYALYAEGSRCRFADDPDKAFDCSHCRHNGGEQFCKANLHLKKVVGLVAEFLAHKNSASTDADPATDEKPQPGWTAEAVESFKAKGMSYEIETPFCPEHIWIVPRKTGKDRIEFTPEEMAFFLQAIDAVDGRITEIGRNRDGEETTEAEIEE